MKQNVKIVSRLVRKAKIELDQGHKDEALELMKKALSIDDTSSLVVQVIQAIGRKQARDIRRPAENPLEDEPVEEPESIEDNPVEEPVEELESIEDSPAEESHSAVQQETAEERKPSMASEDQITELFEASDRAFDNGDQSTAVACLKKARKLDPAHPEIDEKINELKLKIKSLKMIKIARKNLQEGNIGGAITSARQAFDIMPQANGLEKLLEDIEALETVDEDYPEEEAPVEKTDRVYIAEIRRLVQDNSLEDAANLALRSYRDNADDELLSEFVDKFRKLGLIN